MGLVPGFSGDNVLQSDLFTYVPHGRNLLFPETLLSRFAVQ